MLEFFKWAGSSWLGNVMRDSRYAFPLVEMVHLLGLAVLLGSVLLFNVRFFGVGMRRQTLPEVAEDFAPWTRLALMAMVISGIPMFASKGTDLWEQHAVEFSIKMSLIGLGVLFHYLVQVPLARAGDVWRGRVGAAVALTMWFGAAVTGLTLDFL